MIRVRKNLLPIGLIWGHNRNGNGPIMSSNMEKTKQSACKGCGHSLNMAAIPKGEGGPSPNDITVCLYCGHIMAFTDDLGVRNLTSKEMIEVAGSPNLLEVQRFRQAYTEHRMKQYVASQNPGALRPAKS